MRKHVGARPVCVERGKRERRAEGRSYDTTIFSFNRRSDSEVDYAADDVDLRHRIRSEG